MKAVTVIDVFQTSIGQIAVLIFPDKEFPKIGMELKSTDNTIWKIIGVSIPRDSDMTNAYKHLEPSVLLHNCNVKSINTGRLLQKGEILSQQ